MEYSAIANLKRVMSGFDGNMGFSKLNIAPALVMGNDSYGPMYAQTQYANSIKQQTPTAPWFGRRGL